MEYIVTTNNIHIIDSYKISKKDFDKVLKTIEVKEKGNTIVFDNRSFKSLKREWAVHNLAYSLNISRPRSKDVDLNYPQKWYVSFLYSVIGTISLFLIH